MKKCVRYTMEDKEHFSMHAHRNSTHGLLITNNIHCHHVKQIKNIFWSQGMDELMGDRIAESVSEWMAESESWWIAESDSEWMAESVVTEQQSQRVVSGWVSGWLKESEDEWMTELVVDSMTDVSEWVNDWVSGWVNGWVRGWVNGWVRGWESG